MTNDMVMQPAEEVLEFVSAGSVCTNHISPVLLCLFQFGFSRRCGSSSHVDRLSEWVSKQASNQSNEQTRGGPASDLGRDTNYINQAIRQSFTSVKWVSQCVSSHYLKDGRLFISAPTSERQQQRWPQQANRARGRRINARHMLLWSGEMHHVRPTAPIRPQQITSDEQPL